jgi:DNA-binding MarR family transcriptional regulator
MSIQSEELAVAIPHSLRLLARSIGMELDKAGIPMNLSQFSMLDFLLTNSEAVQTDVANHLHKDKSVILRQLDQLEQNGWVERAMDPTDRRRKNLVVTKAGREIHRKGARIRDKVFAQALEGIAPKQVATVLEVLENMARNTMPHVQ